MIEIIVYEEKYHPDFRRLNMYWLEKYGLLESHDLEILDDPQGTVIERGGKIFLAKKEEKIVGSAGIWRENPEEYELVKMAVDQAFHGQGIGKMLLEHCLAEVKRLDAKKIYLFSNSQLKTALKLYEQYGFRHVDVTGAPFETADVKMELSL